MAFDRWRSMLPLRDQRRVGFAENIVRDTRYGLRILGRSPIFTAVAILSLALGIGANAAIFQLIDTIRLRTLRIANPHQLAEVRADGPQAFGNYEGINSKATYPLWELIRANQSAFSGMFAWADAEFLVGRGVEARRARGLWVSGDFFPVLGIAPERGRLLGPSDDRRGCGAGSAVVSDAFWRTRWPLASPPSEAHSPFSIGRSRSSASRQRRSRAWKSGRRSTSPCRPAPPRSWNPSRATRPLVADLMGRLKPDWTMPAPTNTCGR